MILFYGFFLFLRFVCFRSNLMTFYFWWLSFPDFILQILILIAIFIRSLYLIIENIVLWIFSLGWISLSNQILRFRILINLFLEFVFHFLMPYSIFWLINNMVWVVFSNLRKNWLEGIPKNGFSLSRLFKFW